MGKESIVGKIIITGKLTILSPLLIGDGQSDNGEDKDVHVLKDNDENPFIPGTSIAGVMRECVRNILPNHETELFGDMDTIQSSVNFDDIVLNNAQIIYRDGVSIDLYTGAGIEGAKYDYEAVEPGATGDFLAEITLRVYHLNDSDNIKSSLNGDTIEAILLLRDLLTDGIRLGALTTKGFGLAKLTETKTTLYDFAQKADVMAWLMQNGKGDSLTLARRSAFADVNNDDFIVKADFAVVDSLIVRNYNETNTVKTAAGNPVSAVMMKANGKYIIPGTSIKGVLRHQAEKILLAVGKDVNYLDNLMGNSPDYIKNDKDTQTKLKSRFYVSEATFDDGMVITAAHTRNRVDRFTGGTIDNALFTVKPLWQKERGIKSLSLEFFVKQAEPSEAGLVLFLLKDICQGKVAFGGEKNIGRGTLQGLGTTLNYKGQTWQIDKNGKVVEGDAAKLNDFALAFVKGGDVDEHDACA